MGRVFEDSFKIMAVELSCAKGSVSSAALELGIDPGRMVIYYLRMINYPPRSKSYGN